jgi:hypothetical protein
MPTPFALSKAQQTAGASAQNAGEDYISLETASTTLNTWQKTRSARWGTTSKRNGIIHSSNHHRNNQINTINRFGQEKEHRYNQHFTRGSSAIVNF